MVVTLVLPDGNQAKLAKNGEWRSGDRDLREALQAITDPVPTRDYLPDPFADKIEAALRAFPSARVSRPAEMCRDEGDALEIN